MPPAVGVAVLALGFRVLSAFLAFFSNVVFTDFQPEQFTVTGRTHFFWDAFARYDSGWYYQIARFGYSYTPNGRDTIAFFPVYPMLMRHVGRAFGRSPFDLYLGGMVVSWLSFMLAMVGLYKLARLDLTATRSGRAVLLAAVFPFAYFFGAVYTEATFLAATVWAFYFFRTRRWIAGGLSGAVATATRVNGILMVPALAWIVWHQAWRSPVTAESPSTTASSIRGTEAVTSEAAAPQGGATSRPRARPAGHDRLWSLVGLLLVGVGIGAYSVFVYQLSGNPFEWAATLERWGYYPGGAPWLALGRLAQALLTRPYSYLALERLAPYDTLNGVTAIVCILTIPFIWYRLGAAYGLFMMANLWLPLSSGQFEGLGRYCSVLFPVFIWMASVPSRMFFSGSLVVFGMFYTLCMALFTNLHPLF